MNATQDRYRGLGMLSQGKLLPKDLNYQKLARNESDKGTNGSSCEHSGPVLVSFTSLDPSYKEKIRNGNERKTIKEATDELKECSDCVEYFFTSEDFMNHNRKYHLESSSSAELPDMETDSLCKNGDRDSVEEFSQASSPSMSAPKRSPRQRKGSVSTLKKPHSVVRTDLKKKTAEIKQRPSRSAAKKKHYYDKCPYCEKDFINLESHISKKHEHNEDLTCSVAKTEVTTMPNNELIKWKIV